MFFVPSDMPSDGVEVGICNPRLCSRITDPYTQKQRMTSSPWQIITQCTLFGRCTQTSLLPHCSLLNAHRSLSNIFTFALPAYIGVKMNKNHLKQFKKAHKWMAKIAQLEKNNFSVEKKYFSSWKVIFSQLGVSNFLTGIPKFLPFVKSFLSNGRNKAWRAL